MAVRSTSLQSQREDNGTEYYVERCMGKDPSVSLSIYHVHVLYVWSMLLGLVNLTKSDGYCFYEKNVGQLSYLNSL